MADTRARIQKIRIPFNQVLGLVLPYAQSRFLDQIKAVWLIILYLVLFQILVLGIPIAQAGVIAAGMGLVIVGLTFFMEGLLIGLMPLGEVIGIKLPQKTKMAVIMIFSFILGMGVTFAEPAIGVLKVAGASVKAWDAPLLFLLLNQYSGYLVLAVGAGVGIAVVFGMLRFLYNWSLKPFIYVLVAGLTALTLWSYFVPNMKLISGLAWDCGAVTTGPVTVPLVLALGIGISRIVSKSSTGASGFGVVTLASAFPILTVMVLGLSLLGRVPSPMNEKDFFKPEHRDKVIRLFENADQMKGYAFLNAGENSQLDLFDGNAAAMAKFLEDVAGDGELRARVFGPQPDAFEQWMNNKATESQKQALRTSGKHLTTSALNQNTPAVDATAVLKRNGLAALQAILPLSVFLILVLLVLLRERLPRADEIALGILFAILGMSLFNIGIELGLSKLGNQVGQKLPASFKAIDLTEQKTVIRNFSTNLVQTAITPEGDTHKFFFTRIDSRYQSLPFDPSHYNPGDSHYTYVPKKGPLFGKEGGILGMIVVLVFGFIMGYGATLAEPALNALGLKVEELTIGTFKKNLLMQSVALGVGAGIAIGVAKIIWNIPLVWLLAPPYLILLFITALSSEEFVNIGWDSAGVTTGPITVPLVLAMGLGISGQVGAFEGFGILAMASVMPILAVLTVGLYVNNHRKKALTETGSADASLPGASHE